MRAAERAVIGDLAWNGIFRRIKVVILDVEECFGLWDYGKKLDMDCSEWN